MLNQGSSGPNTAEVRVYDDIGNLVGNTDGILQQE